MVTSNIPTKGREEDLHNQSLFEDCTPW
jgi:hypothetical protein